VGILVVLHMLTFWPPHKAQTPFKLACDGLSVVMHLLAQWPIDPTRPHGDLLMVTQSLLSSCSYQIDLVFVQGHQDKGLPMVLSHDAWLNIEADLLAKQKAATLFTGHLYYRLLGNPWGCCLGTQ